MAARPAAAGRVRGALRSAAGGGGGAAMCSGGSLSILRSDSYADLSQYRDQHFRVSGAPPLLPGAGAARSARAGSRLRPRPGCGPAVGVTLSLRLRGRGTTRSGC